MEVLWIKAFFYQNILSRKCNNFVAKRIYKFIKYNENIVCAVLTIQIQNRWLVFSGKYFFVIKKLRLLLNVRRRRLQPWNLGSFEGGRRRGKCHKSLEWVIINFSCRERKLGREGASWRGIDSCLQVTTTTTSTTTTEGSGYLNLLSIRLGVTLLTCGARHYGSLAYIWKQGRAGISIKQCLPSMISPSRLRDKHW